MVADAHGLGSTQPDDDDRVNGSRGPVVPRAGRRLWPAGLLAIGAVFAVSLLAPESARGIPVGPLGPFDPIGDVLGAGAEAITGGMGDLAVDGFGAVIKALFAWPAKLINRELLSWLVAVPDYAMDPETGRGDSRGSNLAELGAMTSAMAFAALGAVGTVSSIRYWVSGLSGSGGLDALEGLGKTVGAALFIVLWPWLFRRCAELANAASAGLLGSGEVIDDTARVLAVAFAAAVAFHFMSIAIAVGAALLLLGLLLTKIAVSVTTALVFVAMPFAVMVWPFPELAWITRTAMRAFATVLVIPLAWAVCFATFAAVGVDALALKGAGKVVDALVMPLVAVALLWVMVALPKTLARMAMFGAMGAGGFVSRTASHLAARRVDPVLSQFVPAAFGGTRGSGSTTAAIEQPSADAGPRGTGRGGGGDPAAASTKRAGAAARAASAAVGAGAGAAAAGAAGAASGGRGWTPPAGAAGGIGRQAETGSGEGLRNPPWQEVKEHVPVELAAAAARQRSTIRADVAAAMRALPVDAQRAVMNLMDANGGQIRGQMAHQAARGDLSDREREAFRTLAAATPDVRAEGISDFVSGADEQPAAPTMGNGATERGASAAGAHGPPNEGSGSSAAAPHGPASASFGIDEHGASRGNGGGSAAANDPPAPPVGAPREQGGPIGPRHEPPAPPSSPAAGGPEAGSSTPPPRDGERSGE